jgi:hypothetical protein
MCKNIFNENTETFFFDKYLYMKTIIKGKNIIF